MIIKNIIIKYNNECFHIEEASCKTKNYNKNVRTTKGNI